MKRFSALVMVFSAAVVLTACNKCSQDKPVEAPPVVEPTPAAPGDVSAAPATEEAPAQ